MDQAVYQIHDLVLDSTTLQLNSSTSVCSTLSGGLDSSILAKIATDLRPGTKTYSIDYVGNDSNFAANDYQLTKDSDFVKIMKSYLNSDHKTIMIDNLELFKLLTKSMEMRQMPGMADIDSAMLAFLKELVADDCKVCLSGECSDEIFGGYPWFYKTNLLEHNGFPWALSNELRANILNNSVAKKGEVDSYINGCVKKTLSNVVHLDSEDDFERRFRDVNYLTIKWFMNTLIERTERASNYLDIDIRIPFADYRIFEYVYNLPAKMKLGLTNSTLPVEKYLLRKAFEKYLPDDIVYRKKSPFPKTYDPQYLSLVENNLQSIIYNKNAPLHRIIQTDFIQHILDIHGENITQNWFGQLMTYPQTLAFLTQINDWLVKYDIEIEI